MFNIVAGHEAYCYEAESVLDEGELPEHVAVTRSPSEFEGYAEPELSDTELLALAAEDAMDAANAGQVLGSGGLDELSLRRVRRSRRQAVASAMREGAIA